jgi:hypothetical protein
MWVGPMSTPGCSRRGFLRTTVSRAGGGGTGFVRIIQIAGFSGFGSGSNSMQQRDQQQTSDCGGLKDY